jgi:hypothetical protein
MTIAIDTTQLTPIDQKQFEQRAMVELFVSLSAFFGCFMASGVLVLLMGLSSLSVSQVEVVARVGLIASVISIAVVAAAYKRSTREMLTCVSIIGAVLGALASAII